jgi:hypothetical protein
MASTQSIARKLGWLMACLLIAGAGCDDDSAASDAEHGDHSHGDGDEHGAAGSGGDEHGEHSHAEPVGDPSGAKCPDGGSTLTYDNFGKKFMQDYCLRCHSVNVTGNDRIGAPDDHNFDELVDIEVFKDHIDQYSGSGPSKTNTTMPPTDPKPSLEERQKLAEWLACGPK